MGRTKKFMKVPVALFLVSSCSSSTATTELVRAEPAADVSEPAVEAATTAPSVDEEDSSDVVDTQGESLQLQPVAASKGPSILIDPVPIAEHPFTLADPISFTSEMHSGGAGLWMALQVSRDFTDHGLIELDPATGEVLRTITIDRPLRLAVGATAVWADSGDAIVRVDAATGDTSTIEGSSPHAWGDNVWINDVDGNGVRIDPITSDVLASGSILLSQLAEAIPDFPPPPDGAPEDESTPLSYVVPGPGAAWSLDGFGVIELDPITGMARHVTSRGPRGDQIELAEKAAPVEGGVWFMGRYEDEDRNDFVRLYFVATGTPGFASEIPLPDGTEFRAPIAADENYVYMLPTEGPLVVVDIAAQAVVASIEHEEFVDNAYALALANDAVWVAVQRELVLEFRAAG